ncbi:hypothetical protein RKD24_006647 [Streptomyces calvus]|jgi:hypothetical protein
MACRLPVCCGCGTCRNSPARNDGGGVRADAEIVLNEAGRAVVAELCGVGPAVLAHALPAFTVDDPKISAGREAALAQARWRSAGSLPVGFGTLPFEVSVHAPTGVHAAN